MVVFISQEYIKQSTIGTLVVTGTYVSVASVICFIIALALEATAYTITRSHYKNIQEHIIDRLSDDINYVRPNTFWVAALGASSLGSAMGAAASLATKHILEGLILLTMTVTTCFLISVFDHAKEKAQRQTGATYED